MDVGFEALGERVLAFGCVVVAVGSRVSKTYPHGPAQGDPVGRQPFARRGRIERSGVGCHEPAGGERGFAVVEGLARVPGHRLRPGLRIW